MTPVQTGLYGVQGYSSDGLYHGGRFSSSVIGSRNAEYMTLVGGSGSIVVEKSSGVR